MTGARATLSKQLPDLVDAARAVTGVPLLVGFGISTPGQAIQAAAFADGIVVGSRAIEVAEQSGAEALLRYVSSLREALDALPIPQPLGS